MDIKEEKFGTRRETRGSKNGSREAPQTLFSLESW